ncbi:unannotated protein [freshwater metagenome]|uniref:Unannotated protein n=1 Tax=freshwater metagenome TaxID=449393 RepID=A0A6J6C440_9ZZZZ
MNAAVRAIHTGGVTPRRSHKGGVRNVRAGQVNICQIQTIKRLIRQISPTKVR